MFDIIKKIAGHEDAGPKGPSPEEQIKIAAGVVLLEAVHADGECSDQEMVHLEQTLQQMFDLSDESLAELLEFSHQERENAIDLWQFTNQINQHYSKEEKIRIMEDSWRIIHIDGQLEKHEDHFAHRLADLLRLTHREMIKAKLRSRENT